MDEHNSQELEAALEAIGSIISKCEKASGKLRAGSAQHTLLVRRIAALRIARSLILEKLERTLDH